MALIDLEFGYYIINIDFHLFVHHVVKQDSHDSLICSFCILEAKGHDLVTKGILRGYE